MKRLLLLHILLAMQVVAFGCDVCKKQQPKVLRGITHGAGPQSDWDYVIVGITALIVLVSLFIQSGVLYARVKRNLHI